MVELFRLEGEGREESVHHGAEQVAVDGAGVVEAGEVGDNRRHHHHHQKTQHRQVQIGQAVQPERFRHGPEIKNPI